MVRKIHTAWLLTVVLAVIAGVCVWIRSSQSGATPIYPQAATTAASVPQIDRSVPPIVNGMALEPPSIDRPVAPAGWAGSPSGIRTNTWWSALSVGRGSAGVFALPLAARVAPTGTTEFSVPTRNDLPDGTWTAEVSPAVIAEFTAPPVVTSAGAFHATWRYDSPAGATTLSMVQGSPFLEFEGSGTLLLTVPAGPNGPGDRNAFSVGRALERGVVIATSRGRWVFAGTPGTKVAIAGTSITFRWPATGGRLIAGPVPTDAPQTYPMFAVSLVTSRIVETTETLRVAQNGSVDQVLSQVRSRRNPTYLWTLGAHQLSTVTPSIDKSLIGHLATVNGVAPMLARSSLTLHYEAVPILWRPVPLDGSGNIAAFYGDLPAPEPLERTSRGSYFGGKSVAQAAMGSLLTNDTRSSEQYRARAPEILRALIDPVEPPNLRWEPAWGKPIIEPAEFGSLTELNDHQLQYGYWVAAASIIVEHDPSAASWLSDTMELLVNDYGGTGRAGTQLDRYGTWNPYDGHTWASGIAQFSAGNNLESSSESNFAFWAAARWYLAIGQPQLAQRFIAMFTIESHVMATDWLPNKAPLDPKMRPWSGVVWSAKTDNGTWFDPAPESALGIRLLPLGPMSLSRYFDEATVEAARRRWTWCESNGGCQTRWANLLDSDAAVAGRSPLAGPDPEPSTTSAMVKWWRNLWTASAPAFEYRCSAGAVARRMPSGKVVVMVTTVGPIAATATCRNAADAIVWSSSIAGGTSSVQEIPRR